MSPSLDVVVIGNALVDVLVHVTDDELATFGVTKGTMALLADESSAEQLYGRLGPAVEMSGGSGANTAVGVAALGGRAMFVGRVRDDQLGEVFTHDIRAAGVRFDTTPSTAGAATGRCLVLVTPDAERTMNTFLGAAAELHRDDLDPEVVRNAAVTYLEGYLWDPPEAREAYRAAIELANDHGRTVALSLSDPFVVARHRAEFRALIEGGIGMVFANRDELQLLYETDDLTAAVSRLADQVPVAAVTLGAAGSIALGGGEIREVGAWPVDDVVDTTGAGDLYAAGFLAGWTATGDAETSARLGSLAAAEVISHDGARPQADLAALASEAGLLG